MPAPEPVENGKKTYGKKPVGIKKSFADKSRGLLSGGKAKESINADAYF